MRPASVEHLEFWVLFREPPSIQPGLTSAEGQEFLVLQGWRGWVLLLLLLLLLLPPAPQEVLLMLLLSLQLLQGPHLDARDHQTTCSHCLAS